MFRVTFPQPIQTVGDRRFFGLIFLSVYGDIRRPFRARVGVPFRFCFIEYHIIDGLQEIVAALRYTTPMKDEGRVATNSTFTRSVRDLARAQDKTFGRQRFERLVPAPT